MIQGSLKFVHLQIYLNFMNDAVISLVPYPATNYVFHCLLNNINSQEPKYDFLTIQFIF